MKHWFSNLNTHLKTALVSTIVTLVAFVGTLCLFFMGLMEIPLGILLGSSIGIIFYVIIGKISNDKKVSVTITIQIIRFILIALALILSAWLYYKENIHLFNVFAVLGGYTIPLITLIVFTRKEQDTDGNIR